MVDVHAVHSLSMDKLAPSREYLKISVDVLLWLSSKEASNVKVGTKTVSLNY